jgi:hypothetical protein
MPTVPLLRHKTDHDQLAFWRATLKPANFRATISYAERTGIALSWRTMVTSVVVLQLFMFTYCNGISISSALRMAITV